MKLARQETEAAWRGEQLLRRGRGELVGDGVARGGVEDGGVGDLERAVVLGRGVVARRVRDGGLEDLVEVAVGVGDGFPGGRVGFFVVDGVVVAVDGGVDACFR